MKKIYLYLITLLIGMLFCSSVFALPLQRLFQDIKLPTQSVLETQTFTNLAAASTTALALNIAGPTDADALVVTTGFTQPDQPRNLTISTGGTTADGAGCVVTINGTNFLGGTISEDFTITDNQTIFQTTTGSQAFKTITNISFAANCEEGGFAATWTIGYGDKIGLKRCMDYAGDWAWSMTAGTYDSTRATVTADADEVEKNVVDFYTATDGTTDFKSFYVQNFRCF